MTPSKDVRGFLATYYASHGVEVKSSGDASVTVAVPVHTDLTALVYDLKEEFNADCDLKLDAGVPVVVIHLQRNYSASSTHFMLWFLLVAAMSTTLAAVSQGWANVPANITWPF